MMLVLPTSIEATFDGKVFVPDIPVLDIPPGSHVRLSLRVEPESRHSLQSFLSELSATLQDVPSVATENIDRGDLYK